jgi:hypothetical protein
MSSVGPRAGSDHRRAPDGGRGTVLRQRRQHSRVHPGARRPRAVQASLHSTKYGPPTYDIWTSRFRRARSAEWLVLEYNDLFFAFVTVGNDPVLSRSLLRPKDAGIEGEINEAEANSAGTLSCIGV